MVIVSIENGNCSLNGVSVANLKWKPRKVSAVRDFPPGCGPIVQTVNAVSQGAEASQNEATEPGTDHNVETKSLVNNGGDPKNAVVQVDDGKLLSFTNGTDNGGGDTKEGLTKKFPKRRVSAVRDFPPYCGLNAPEPSEEERIRINGRRKCEADDTGGGRNVRLIESNVRDSSNESPTAKQETEMIVVGEEAKVEFEDGKIEKLEHDVIAVGPRKKVHNIGQACQALVVYTRENIVKRKCSDDEVSEGEKIQDTKDKDVKNIVGQRVGYDRSVKKRLLNNDMRFSGDKICCVLGLKAPSFCAPGTLEKDIGSKAKGSQDSTTPTQRNEEKVVLGKSSSSGKVAYAGTYEMVVRDEEDDFVVDTEEQEERRLVLGLRAPLLCPPQIPASMTQKKSIKRKGKNQEKVVREELNSNRKVAYTGSLEMVVREEDFCVDTEGQEEILNSHEKHDLDVTLPPFGPRSSSDARNKVREILRLFQGLCRKILQGEEAKNNELTSAAPIKRVDLAAKAIIDKRGRALDVGKKTYGPVPGVEVGDEFQYRVELALVGIHRIFQGGIDYVKQGKDLIAVSVVASGGYDNEIDKPDCLIYSGAGGVAKDKSFENQKLERGNLALKNNINLKIPVRVIRGYKVKPAESSDSKSKLMTTYIYDGLYTVDDYKQEPGPHGNIVFKFELKRIPGQPELALREVKSKKFKTREGVCSNDIANGKEAFRISAINTIDDEKPPVFTYITRIMYPDWYRPFPPKGCDCVGRCSNKRCSCAFKNGGEIPYNHNGAIVEAKPLVYECGPSCRCPPSCYNRVTQHGMRIPLEIFKTESRGWGVRSLSSISSGSFICEYIGELLEDTEAEKRTGNDEYLFDIGQNYSDCSLTPDTKSGEIVGSGGFTIDAANYGNVGRFINHSCTPNLYAQNVLYDQEDKRMPHIMLFAAENIPPLQELTYHYNYTVDTVHDSDGNIKVKNCYCGSSECTGRLY